MEPNLARALSTRCQTTPEAIERLARYIVFSEVEYVLLQDIVEFFPPNISNRQIKKILLAKGDSDAEDVDAEFAFRFIDQGGDELLIGVKNLSDDFKKLLVHVEEWKQTMCQVLEKLHNHNIEFSSFESIVPRPQNIPPSILLKDVLRSDLSHRFSWYGPSDKICIQSALQPELRDQLIQQKLEDALLNLFLTLDIKKVDLKFFSSN